MAVLSHSEGAVDSVIEFLERCGDADIEAGIGFLMACGNAEEIAAFRQGLATAIELHLGKIVIEITGSGGP